MIRVLAALAAIITLLGATPSWADATQALKGTQVIVRAGNPASMDFNKPVIVTLDGSQSGTDLSALAGQQLTLFLNGTEMTGIANRPYPVPPAVAGQPTTWDVSFFLQRNDGNQAAWKSLLSSRNGWGTSLMPVAVSVGLAGNSALAVPAQMQLRLFKDEWWAIGLVVAVAVALVIFVLAKKSGLLRDPAPAEAAGIINIPILNRPYSLARTQMAFWLVVTAGSYVFLVLATADPGVFSSDALILLGIATGTTLGATVIDSSKNAANDSAASLREQARAIFRDANSTPQAKESAKAVLKGQPHDHWLTDVLSDTNGISVHRLQALVWTVILGVIFVIQVRTQLAMPEFGQTLLTLMGISNGAYLGFKIPEKSS